MITHLYRRFIFTIMDGIPRILYKYRDWENSFHKNLLIQSEIFLAPASSFNDPFDASFPLRYDSKELTPDKIFMKYAHLAKLKYPHFTDQEIHEYAYRHQSRDLLFDGHHLERHNIESQERFNRAFGILSLSSKQDNLLMWSHYANSHKGFCVGIDSSRLFDQLGGALGEIHYVDEFPTFGLFEDYTSQAHKSTFFKSKDWAYEAEYRLLKGEMPILRQRSIQLEEDTIVEVILGLKMDFNTKREILNLVEHRYPAAEVYDTFLHKSVFALELMQIR